MSTEARKQKGGKNEGEGRVFHGNNGEPLYHYLPTRLRNRRLIPEVQYRLSGNRAGSDIHREQQAFAASPIREIVFSRNFHPTKENAVRMKNVNCHVR